MYFTLSRFLLAQENQIFSFFLQIASIRKKKCSIINFSFLKDFLVFLQNFSRLRLLSMTLSKQRQPGGILTAQCGHCGGASYKTRFEIGCWQMCRFKTFHPSAKHLNCSKFNILSPICNGCTSNLQSCCLS